MKFFAILAAILLSNLTYSAPVEYVKICSTLGDQNQVTLGPGWYIIPGIVNSMGGVCLQTTTGLTQYLSNDGNLIRTQSPLEARVTQLEKKIAFLLAKKQLNHS